MENLSSVLDTGFSFLLEFVLNCTIERQQNKHIWIWDVQALGQKAWLKFLPNN